MIESGFQSRLCLTQPVVSPDVYSESVMSQIRPFLNADLPFLVDLWVRHWSTFAAAPDVSTAMIEQAILARTYFDPNTLLVAEVDRHIHAWCHWVPLPESETAILAAVCFSPEGGLSVCQPLLEAAETRVRESGFNRIVVGPLRDTRCGYAGLSPIGHGIGVPVADTRTSSLLSQAGYDDPRVINRLRVTTSPYRAPISRQALQLGRTTRLEAELLIPEDPQQASAMSHLDVECHRLVDHRSRKCLAAIELWTSDPEIQVMMPWDAILHLGDLPPGGVLEAERAFLIGALIRTLSNRCIFHVETAVDQEQTALIGQLKTLHFQLAETGVRWEKQLS